MRKRGLTLQNLLGPKKFLKGNKQAHMYFLNPCAGATGLHTWGLSTCYLHPDVEFCIFMLGCVPGFPSPFKKSMLSLESVTLSLPYILPPFPQNFRIEICFYLKKIHTCTMDLPVVLFFVISVTLSQMRHKKFIYNDVLKKEKEREHTFK